MRIMPPKGFYVYVDTSTAYIEVIYTTGIQGGGNHKYYRSSTSSWSTLLWSCVPKQERLQSHTFYPSWEDIPSNLGIPPPPPDVQRDPPKIKPPHPTKIRKEDVVQNLRVRIVDTMKGLSNYGFFLHLNGSLSETLTNLNTSQQGKQDPSILENGQHLVVTRSIHSRSGRGKYVTVRCEETGAEGDIYLCDLTQKCEKIP